MPDIDLEPHEYGEKGRRRPSWFLAVTAALIAGPAAAQGFYDGNKLFDQCSTGVVGFYAAGLVDLNAWQTVVDTKDGGIAIVKSHLCVPAGVTIEQVGDIVCKYLTDNPGVRHFSAAYLTLQALEDDFPCQP